MKNSEIKHNFEAMEKGSTKNKKNLWLLLGLLLLNVVGYSIAKYYFNKNEITEADKLVQPQHSSLNPTIVDNSKTLDWALWLLQTLRGE